jgi:iron(III) transport system substrate-binding protein
MKWIVALFVAALLAGSAFGVAACAGSSRTAPAAVTPSASPAAAPQPTLSTPAPSHRNSAAHHESRQPIVVQNSTAQVIDTRVR